MIHPDTELCFISAEIGYGVFATQLIPQGTIIWALDELDQILRPSAVAALSPAQRVVFDKYSYVDCAENHILCWDLGRFVNHSCDPTGRGVGVGFEIAVRDIHPGEELTCEYSTLNITESFECACDSANCRRVVHPHDVLQHGQAWDLASSEAFMLIATLPQPLWEIVLANNQHNWSVVEALSDQNAKLPSYQDYYISAEVIKTSLKLNETVEDQQELSSPQACTQRELSIA